MPEPRRAATLADVAELAGVTVGTASKAMNNRGSLRAETRQRVMAAAEQLGFSPNPLAQGLLAGRSWTVGLITTDSIGRFSIPVLLGAEDALGPEQMSVLLCDSRGDAIREAHYLRTLMARRIDGIIVTGRRTDPRPPLPGNPDVPTVYALGPSSDPDDTSVVPDEHGGARLAIRHLAESGRRRIAHITGPERHHSATVRAAAAAGRLAEAGLDLAGAPMFGEWSEAWGRQAVRMLLGSETPFDAVFCGSDQIARGAADALQAAGRRVPADVALVGFDNWDVMALGCQPPLTSVDMELEALGRTAADRLLAAINGEPAPGRHTRPCRLVIRDSTA